jgi:hypothetical protein
VIPVHFFDTFSVGGFRHSGIIKKLFPNYTTRGQETSVRLPKERKQHTMTRRLVSLQGLLP